MTAAPTPTAAVRAAASRWPAPTPTPASSGPTPARPAGPSPKAPATAAGGLFSPQSKSLGIDQAEASLAVLDKTTYAAATCRSYAEAAATLGKLADLPTGPKQVERVAQRIGGERVAERDAAASAYQALPLATKVEAPAGVAPPPLAVVMADGGRWQVRDSRDGEPPAAGAAADEDFEEAAPAKHWREDKVGLLLVMASPVSATDPCPEIPRAFVDPLRIPKLARELKKNARRADAAAPAEEAEPEAAEEALREAPAYEPPRVVQRRVVASGRPWRAFAPLVAQAAWAWGFPGAARKAFVGDGSANNWRLQRRCFASFVAILDFIHALSYVFAAAVAGRPFAAGWACYEQWIGWAWQGQVGRVIAALEGRQAELGAPAADEAETSPRQVVAQALTYLRNQQDKMRYDEYRRQGLPITSSLLESTVKQVGRRVKGAEKFWTEAGGEAILQLRADYLSDDQPLEAFWQRRQDRATGRRRYRKSG